MDIKSVSSSSVPSYQTGTQGTDSASGTKVAKDNSDNAAAVSRRLSEARTKQASDMADLQTRRVEQMDKLDKQRELQRDQLEQLVERMDEFVSTFNKGLSFRIDEQSGRNVVTVYEVKSGDVVRQIPNEEMLELSKQIAEFHGGLMSTKV
ncbi:flagellar protein FlaG [Thaumasiovibrio subtropicus]|uniref:flagellar protein FlaG n=1 Tax=Thaumasiovibrio subtropicus TaxID=1891207 RepID=UPI000B34B894|nr:flagellar protein FlaG [Thaumasiovibrio subtropicus]